MIRDMDLLRKIVLELEACNDIVNSHSIKVPDAEHEVIAYHCLLLYDAGLIDVTSPPFLEGRNRNQSLLIRRLSSTGHDFLDQIRSEEKWTVAKRIMGVAEAVTLPILLAKLQQMTSDGWDHYMGKIAQWVSENLS